MIPNQTEQLEPDWEKDRESGAASEARVPVLAPTLGMSPSLSVVLFHYV